MVDSEDAVEEEAVTEETTEAEAEETTEAEAEETTEDEAEETTEAEAEETTEAETEETAQEEIVDAAAELSAQTWQWIEVDDPVQGTQEIDAPENHTIDFSPEGGVSVQADCNTGTGSYTVEGENLTISVPAMTLAICQEGSLGDAFVNYLHGASTYSIEDGVLIITMAPDGGTLTFVAEGAAVGEAGTGGAEETEEATEETTEGEEATTEEAAEGEEMAEPVSIAEIAAGDEQFSTLVTALEAAGLVETLAGEGEFTVFAPPNDAFDALPEGTLDELLADPEGALNTVLLYHVVAGVVPAEAVVALNSADTLAGEAVAISVVDDEVFLNEVVQVVATDIEASNGIIHVIDAVLIPPSMTEEEMTEGEATTEEATEETTEGEEAATEEATEETTEGEEAATEEEAAPEGEGPGLVGGIWQWAEFNDTVEGPVTIENPELYTAEFLDDGTVSIQADCNSGRGSYTANGSTISISDVAMTRALCAEGSMSDDFVMYLQMAAIYFFDGGNLYMDLPADGGTMMFIPAEGEETSSFVRSAAMKVAAQNGEEEEDLVPSFEICTVVQNETVAVVTADFPEDEEFNVTMGPVLVYTPMKPKYGPMPMPEQMSVYPPMVEPYPMGPNMGSMGPNMGSMGPNMGSMGPNMDSMYMGPPKGGMAMGMGYGDMWGKPMPPKVYVPFYYEVDSFTAEDGTMELEFEIPSELAGYYRIQIMMRTEHQYPYYSYNWFYNNDAEVCDNNNG
jgi:uncharacterized surface protein with fasciclin (FAS1) repeats